MSVTASVVVALALALALGATLSVGAAEASVSEFGSLGSGAGQFTEPRGVAVDQSSGDVYVVDRRNARIDKFTRQGAFLLAWGWGVADGTSEALQVCTATCFAGISGTGAGQFNEGESVAVDNSLLSSSNGDVYVIDRLNNRVQKFGPEGEFLLVFGGEVNAITHGDVCVGNEACQAGKAGTGHGEFEALGNEGAVAVGPNGDVYVGSREHVQVFSPGGVYQREIAVAPGASVLAVAVDPSGDVYLTETEAGLFAPKPEVLEFSPAGVLIRTLTLTAAFSTSAHLASDASGHLFVDDFFQEQFAAAHERLLEFNSSGQELLSFPPPGGEGQGGNGLGFVESAGEVLVLEASVVRTAPLPPAGPLVESEQATPEPAGAATLSAGIDPENKKTQYHFDYGLDASAEIATATVTMPAEGFDPETLQAKLSGLKAQGVYHYHVVAEDSEHHVTEGSDRTFQAFPAARVDSLSVTGVTATSAKLEAEINPLATDTAYQFEYGTGAKRTLLPEVSIGGGATDVPVSAEVQGLLPGSVYQYKVLVKNTLGEVQATREFTSQAATTSAALPDGRAWELVSPAEKHGAQIYAIGQYSGEGAVIQAAADGSAITYVTSTPFDVEPPGYTNLSHALSTRGPDGWSSQDIALPHNSATGLSITVGDEYRFFSEDLSLGIAQPFGDFMPSLSGEASEQTPYLRTDYSNGNVGEHCSSSCYRPLVTRADDTTSPFEPFGQQTEGKCRKIYCGPSFLDATPDASHIIITSDVALTATPTTSRSLYEWSAGKLALISVLPPNQKGEETPASNEPALGYNGLPEADSSDTRRSISNDGSRVIWGEKSGEHHLYMRDTVKGETVQLDVPEPGVATGTSAEPFFQTAGSTGSRVFFTDAQRLTSDSGAESSNGVPRPDLYECEMVEKPKLECRLSDLTPAHGGEGAQVVGNVLGASEDGSSVYFVADGVLAEGAKHGTCDEYQGQAANTCNLYLRRNGTTSLVAVLSGEDGPDWFRASAQQQTARVSPDGRWLAFMSQRELTGYDTHDALSGKLDEEVYLYGPEGSTGAGRVVCASCDPSGARPHGVEYKHLFNGVAAAYEAWPMSTWLAANIPGLTPYRQNASPLYQSRYLSDSGRLFFNSSDALVPQDVNGTEDVYEYEPLGIVNGEGKHPCTEATATFGMRSGGCVALISSGSSAEESAFLDASENGSDVFFLTTAKLSPQDPDQSLDIYDAHECTGAVPCVSSGSSAPQACDTGDSCKAAPSPQPGVFGSPASSTFSGMGNVAPSPPLAAVVKKTAAKLRREELAKALRACRKDKKKAARTKCEAAARRRYAVKKQAKAKKTKKPSNGRRAK